MNKYLTIAEAKAQLAKLPDRLNDEPVIVTLHGKPAMVILSAEQFESLIETVDIIGDREFMAYLRQGIKEAIQEDTITLEDLNSNL